MRHHKNSDDDGKKGLLNNVNFVFELSERTRLKLMTISIDQELVNYFDFHNYDLKGASSGRKLDPRRRKAEVQVCILLIL